MRAGNDNNHKNTGTEQKFAQCYITQQWIILFFSLLENFCKNYTSAILLLELGTFRRFCFKESFYPIQKAENQK